jgi:parallel beta-helix repeat protein
LTKTLFRETKLGAFKEQKCMNNGVALFFVLAILLAPFIVQLVKADARTIVVPDDYATIQSAVDAAHDGDFVYLKNGVYHENLRIDKSISLIGEGDGRKIIDGNWSESYLRPITINHNNVTVNGFTLIDSWAGVCLNKVSGCDVSWNEIINNHYGIILSDASGNSINSNVINSAKFGSYAIQLNRASNNVVKGNQITNTDEGIQLTDQLLSQNSVITCQNNTIIENNLTHCNENAIWFEFTKENLMVGNTLTNCLVELALFETDNNIVYHNNFINYTKQVAAGAEPIWSGGKEVRYSICQWDNGKEGNYWSDYIGTDVNRE